MLYLHDIDKNIETTEALRGKVKNVLDISAYIKDKIKINAENVSFILPLRASVENSFWEPKTNKQTKTHSE